MNTPFVLFMQNNTGTFIWPGYAAGNEEVQKKVLKVLSLPQVKNFTKHVSVDEVRVLKLPVAIGRITFDEPLPENNSVGIVMLHPANQTVSRFTSGGQALISIENNEIKIKALKGKTPTWIKRGEGWFPVGKEGTDLQYDDIIAFGKTNNAVEIKILKTGFWKRIFG